MIDANFSLIDTVTENGDPARGIIDLSETTDRQRRPIVIDFLSSKMSHRIKSGVDAELIVKSIGVKRSERPGLRILDFTAGMGVEAFLLAQAGFSIVAFERDVRVFELLNDALSRYRKSGRTIELEFQFGDATLLELGKAYAVTLDPMYEGEATDAKSRPKKAMEAFRKMLSPSSQGENAALFRAAQRVAEARIVVKRPAGAPDLVATDESGRVLRPTHRLLGKTARFDIYSCR